MKRGWIVIGLLLAVLPACHTDRGDDGGGAASAAPAAIGGAECAACGMVVREQPAPRGQLVFRDGTRAFACSVGDLVQVLAAPSPHGSVEHTWVESLPAGVAPGAITASAPTKWIDATRGFYVLGVDRPGVMGKPVLVYAARADAARVAQRTGGHVVEWGALRGEIMGSHVNR